jgi:twitching motility two-component system response regulator PilG
VNSLGVIQTDTGQVSAAALLRDGIAAAQAGNKAAARALLLRAVELEPGGELGWLWLVSVAENAQQSILYLRRALEIVPHHEQARAALRKALAQHGIEMARAGEKGKARALLLEASEMDPGNEAVWLWLTAISEDPAEMTVWLRKALEINPANERTLEWLRRLRPAPPPPPPKVVPRCPMCEAEWGERRDRCPDCGAILTLADLDALIGNRAADRVALFKAVERYQARLQTQAGGDDFNAHLYLGLARLNLNQVAEALKSLQEALRLRPSDETLKAQALALWRRHKATLDALRKEHGGGVRSRTILIVDDSATVRKLVTVTLERRGHRVLAAGGVMEALSRLNEAEPDLILLDVSLPHTDGFQICKLIKGSSNTREIPVVFLSGKDGFLDKVRGRMAGAVGYLTKPVEPAALVKAVESYCKQAARQ